MPTNMLLHMPKGLPIYRGFGSQTDQDDAHDRIHRFTDKRSAPGVGQPHKQAMPVGLCVTD